MEFSILRILKRASVACILGLMVSTPISADHLNISRYFSGAWQQPDHESQGLVLHIAQQEEDEKVGVAHWFTFAEDLDSAWFLAAGPIEGHEINMVLYSASGIGFLEADLPGDPMVEEVGTLVLSFHNCNQGTATFETPEEVIGSGTFRIRRLTSLYHSRCSGGISDDTPSDKRPEKLAVRLEPAREDISGSGKAQFWERADRSDFMVSAEDLPDGTYDLFVCGFDEGDLEVLEGEGSLAFRSPGIDSKELLSFYPQGCLIELHDEAGAALTSGDQVLAAMEKGHGGHEDNLKISADMVSTGEIEGAAGHVRLMSNPAKTEFTVSISNVPEGSYQLLVDGMDEGSIDVLENDGELKGQLKFSDPKKAETEELDFNPRGAIIEVLQGEAIVLEALFPEE